VESGHAAAAVAPVLCAGASVRYPSGWALRLASFRLDRSDLGSAALGVLTPRSVASVALVELLSGRVRPRYGTVRILGYDVTTTLGRTAVRRQVGTASRTQRPMPAVSIRRLVERAARRSGQSGSDRQLLVAAILDRLALTAWAEVPLSAAPELVARKARLAAASVHQPKLLLIDGLLDQLPPLDRTVLADVIRDLERDTAVIALGNDSDTLSLVCDHVLVLRGGILAPPVAQPSGLRPAAATWASSMVMTSRSND
jgi:ABC-2 type transport system ATP-binding protein